MTAQQQPEAAASSLRIVVAEDDVNARFLLQSLLEKLGHTVELVTNGQELIERCAALDQPVDVVITDLGMPVVDGITAIETISQMRSLPFIAISGNQDDSVVERALQAGCVDFVAKDCLSLSQLRIDLQVAFVHHRSRQEHDRLLRFLARRSDKISRAKMVLMQYWGVPGHRLDQKFAEIAADKGDDAAADAILALDPSSARKESGSSPQDIFSALLS